MTRVIRNLTLALVFVTILGGIFGGTSAAEAANGYEQWVGPVSDGCYYYWNGFDYTTGACPVGNGSFNLYLPGNGQWTYAVTAGYDVNGCFYVTDGVNTDYACPDTVFQNYTDSWLDGMSNGYESTWAPTGNALLDSMTASFNAHLNGTWFQPNCVQVIGNTCYYQS